MSGCSDCQECGAALVYLAIELVAKLMQVWEARCQCVPLPITQRGRVQKGIQLPGTGTLLSFLEQVGDVQMPPEQDYDDAGASFPKDGSLWSSSIAEVHQDTRDN